MKSATACRSTNCVLILFSFSLIRYSLNTVPGTHSSGAATRCLQQSSPCHFGLHRDTLLHAQRTQCLVQRRLFHFVFAIYTILSQQATDQRREHLPAQSL